MEKKPQIVRNFFVIVVLVFLSSAAPLLGQSSADRELDRILEREWSRLMSHQPLLAIYLGEKSDREWPASTPSSRESDSRHYREVIEELNALEQSELSAEQTLNLRLFREQLQWQVERHRHGLDLFVMNQRDGLHTAATLADSLSFESLEDYRRWVERLESFPRYAQLERATLQESLEQGRVHPKIIAERMLDRVRVQPPLHADGEKSPFYEPFLKGEAKFGGDREYEDLKVRAVSAIENGIAPEFVRLVAFLEQVYLPAAPRKVGLGNLPGGEEAYRFLVRRYTTTDLTPDQIHGIGLSEVERIRNSMEKIKSEVGFEGTLEQFFDHLRGAPEHYTSDPRELLQRYRSFCKQVDGQMPKLFKTLPRKPYGVEPIPDYIAPATTTAYYLPGAGHLAGTYYVNLYKPETRAFFEIPALSLHESVPGHHHQIALAQELSALPKFRSKSDGFGDYTVFVEGWALYAESLGEEMGLYKDPYDRFGRLTYEMWRAIRLVVDTGIHAKGWSREQAIEYFLSNSPRSELDVTNEIDRYISWPGQALAYKTGELEIKKLRRMAEAELGAKFSLPEFHDAVLKEGAVPLSQLRRQVRSYVQAASRQRK